MKKEIYLQPEVTISDMVMEAYFAVGLSQATGMGGNDLVIGDAEDDEDVAPTANHLNFWDDSSDNY
jgi:hypothetical protein